MRIGISSTLVKDSSIFPLIELMGERRFLFIEIRCKSGHFDYEDIETIKKLKATLKRAGVTPLALHPPDWIDIGSQNEWERMRSVREVEKCILVAEKLRIQRIILHPANSTTEISIIRESLDEIIPFSEEWGVEVVLENPFPPKTGSDLETLKALSDGYKVGICLDTSHLFANGVKEYSFIRGISGLIKELHASDTLFSGRDDHLLPGEGKLNWKEIFNNIDNDHIDVIIELMPAKKLEKRLDEIEGVMERWLSGLF